MRATNTHRACAGIVLLLLSNAIGATCPMFDRIELEGKQLMIYKNTEFPKSAEYTAWWRGLPRCSAANQGRAVYRVVDNKIYLTGFSSCNRENPKPSQLYPGK